MIGEIRHSLESARDLAQPCTVISTIVVVVVVVLQCRSFDGIGAAMVVFRWHWCYDVAVLVAFVLLESLSRFVNNGTKSSPKKLQSWLSCSSIVPLCQLRQ